MEIIDIDDEYLEGDDTMMFTCIKSALVHLIKDKGAFGIDIQVAEDDSYRLSVIGDEGAETLQATHADTILNESDVKNHRTENGILFRGLMCLAINGFIPQGCGMVVSYQDHKYMVGNRHNGVAVDKLDEDQASNVKIFDKFRLVHEEDDMEEVVAPQQVVVNGPITEEMALALLGAMSKPGYLN